MDRGKILILMGTGDLGSPSVVLHSTRTQFLLSICTGMRKVAEAPLVWQIQSIFIFHLSLQCHTVPKTGLISSQTHFPIPNPFSHSKPIWKSLCWGWASHSNSDQGREGLPRLLNHPKEE